MNFWILLAAFAVPLGLWLLWLKTARVIYKGEGTIFPPESDLKPIRKDRQYLVALLPGKAAIPVDVPNARAEALQRPKLVQLEVRKRLLGSPWVETITWEKDGKPEPAEQHSNGLFVGIYFLVFGLYLMSVPQMFASMLAIMLSGFLVGGVALSSLNMAGLATAERVKMYIWLGISGLGAIYLFREVSIVTFILGTLFAFSFGQIAGMFALAWGQAEAQEQEGE